MRRRRSVVGREGGKVDLLLRVVVARRRRRRVAVGSRRGWRRVESPSSLRRLRDGRVVDVDGLGASALGRCLLLLLPRLAGVLPDDVLPLGLKASAVLKRERVSERTGRSAEPSRLTRRRRGQPQIPWLAGSQQK